MNLDLTYSNLPWDVALTKIVGDVGDSMQPALIIRGDDPVKVRNLHHYISTLKHTFLVRMGPSTNTSYALFELLTQLDPKFSVKRRPGLMAQRQLCMSVASKIKKLNYTPVIVFDRCQHLGFLHLFRFLGLINHLQGKALFLFMLPEEYMRRWFDDSRVETKGQSQRNHFLKLVDKKYALQG